MSVGGKCAVITGSNSGIGLGVAEELARLASHLGQFRALLREGGPIGRKLDFLAQELHREVNTIASKADDAELVARVLEARTLVERIREQVQNVE